MNKRKFVVVLSITVIAILIIAFINFLSGLGKDVVSIVSAPKDASLILDNTKTIKPGKQKLKTGTHTIIAKRNGFDEQIKQFDTSQTNIVWFNLSPNSDEGRKYVQNHSDEYDTVYEIAKAQTAKRVENKVSDYPLIRKLPANVYPLFIINYDQSKKFPYDDTKIAIYITSNAPDGKQSALKYIYVLGFDPSDYEIVFITEQEETGEDTSTGIGDTVEDNSEVNSPGVQLQGEQ
jgi:hypothetical protein